MLSRLILLLLPSLAFGQIVTPINNPKLLGAGDFNSLTNKSTVRTHLGLAIGTNVQAYDADLTTLAGTMSWNGSELTLASVALVLDQVAAVNFNGGGVGLEDLNATQLTSGTVPDARFPATLPASSGANLTSLNATNLTSGTVANARLDADLQSFVTAGSWVGTDLTIGGSIATSEGDITAAASLVSSTYSLGGNSYIVNDGASIIKFLNSTVDGAPLLRLGGGTASFPAIKRSSTEVQFRLADDSGFAPISAASATFTTPLPIASGGTGYAAIPRFKAHKNGTNQTVTAGVATKASFGTEVWDVGGFFDTTNSRWTPPASRVRLHFNLYAYTYGGGGSNSDIHIYKNGSEVAVARLLFFGGQQTTQITFEDSANGTDYYEAWGTTPDATTWDGRTTHTWFTGEVLP